LRVFLGCETEVHLSQCLRPADSVVPVHAIEGKCDCGLEHARTDACSRPRHCLTGEVGAVAGNLNLRRVQPEQKTPRRTAGTWQPFESSANVNFRHVRLKQQLREGPSGRRARLSPPRTATTAGEYLERPTTPAKVEPVPLPPPYPSRRLRSKACQGKARLFPQQQLPEGLAQLQPEMTCFVVTLTRGGLRGGEFEFLAPFRRRSRAASMAQQLARTCTRYLRLAWQVGVYRVEDRRAVP
jgi:hypothetical protein